jgi:Xaa-Pro aminopeptidase
MTNNQPTHTKRLDPAMTGKSAPIGPKPLEIRELVEQHRETLRNVMRESQIDLVLAFSTRDHTQPALWILGAACKSDCHYSFITQEQTGVLEMPWRIPGLKPRLLTEEVLIGVAGEHLMNEAIRQLCTERNVRRVGIIGDAPFTHLQGLPVELLSLTDQFATEISVQQSQEVPVGLTVASSVQPLGRFPLSDLDRELLGKRLRDLRSELVSTGTGAALLYGTNKKGQYARWLTGVPTVSESEVILVKTDSISVFDLGGGPEVDEKRAYSVERSSFDSRLAMQEAINRELSGISVIGVVKEFPYDVLTSLSNGKKIVNMNATIEGLMAVKGPQELAIMRHSAQDLATLMETTLATITSGMSGKDLEAALDKQITLCGSTRSFPIGVAADDDLQGENATTLAEPLSSQTIREAVCIDMGIQFAGLVTDATRMGFVGNPPIKAEYERLRQVVEDIVTDLRPGQTVREFYDSVLLKLASRGFDVSTLGVEELGHGLGFDLHEEPFLVIKSSLDMKFLPGMVVCVEPEVLTPYGKIRVEEMVEITDHGATIMTRPRDN